MKQKHAKTCATVISLCQKGGGVSCLFLFNNGILKLPCMGRPLTEGRLRKASSKKTIRLFSEFKTSFPPFGSFNFQTVRTGSHFGTGFY